MQKGWLKIPGVQDGDRSLAEQLLGLEPALADCDRKTVYDFGCAEGLIGIEFGKRGASMVSGCDMLPQFVREANRQADLVGLGITCQFYEYDLRGFCEAAVPPGFPEDSRFDIVLALAIVHKMWHPEHALRNMAMFAKRRVVIRLPLGSTGKIEYKFTPKKRCHTGTVMPALGFVLEQTLDGPRGELVQHWVRM